MFKRLAFWHGRTGTYNNTSICARTLLVYQTLDGCHEFWFGDPGILENVGRHSGWLGNSCYEYTTLVRKYCRLLLVHLRELRRPLLNSDCTNACAFNGLPGPMRHWFTGFTHSLLEEKCFTSRGVEFTFGFVCRMFPLERIVALYRSAIWGSGCQKGSPLQGAIYYENKIKQVWKENGYFVQNFAKSSTSTIHCSAFAATFFQSYHCLIREKCSNLLAQCIAGCPTDRLPHNCQCIIRRTHRSLDRLMM